MKKTSLALIVAGLMAAGPALAQGMGGTGTAGGTAEYGPAGHRQFCRRQAGRSRSADYRPLGHEYRRRRWCC